MSNPNRELVDKIIPLVLEAAKDQKQSAAFSGRWDDGGAAALEMQVKFFRYGLSVTIPPEWDQYKKQLDPEYVEYMRLKRKFG